MYKVWGSTVMYANKNLHNEDKESSDDETRYNSVPGQVQYTEPPDDVSTQRFSQRTVSLTYQLSKGGECDVVIDEMLREILKKNMERIT